MIPNQNGNRKTEKKTFWKTENLSNDILTDFIMCVTETYALWPICCRAHLHPPSAPPALTLQIAVNLISSLKMAYIFKTLKKPLLSLKFIIYLLSSFTDYNLFFFLNFRNVKLILDLLFKNKKYTSCI